MSFDWKEPPVEPPALPPPEVKLLSACIAAALPIAPALGEKQKQTRTERQCQTWSAQDLAHPSDEALFCESGA